MEALLLQVLNGLDKGAAYALIAIGLTLVFGTLGVVNFAHGALFMLGAFVAVSVQNILTISKKVKDESITFFDAYKETPYLEIWWGDFRHQPSSIMRSPYPNIHRWLPYRSCCSSGLPWNVAWYVISTNVSTLTRSW